MGAAKPPRNQVRLAARVLACLISALVLGVAPTAAAQAETAAEQMGSVQDDSADDSGEDGSKEGDPAQGDSGRDLSAAPSNEASAGLAAHATPAPGAGPDAETSGAAAPSAAHAEGAPSGGGSRTAIFFGVLAALFLLVSALAGANDKPTSAPPV